jgi:NhaP-type Na+/H+ or K+/H+ antiporter
MTLVGCIVGRILNIFPLAALVNCCRRPDDQVSLRGQLLMSFAGLRGAIAFALALTFPEPGRQLVISATIVTVLSSTMVRIPPFELRALPQQSCGAVATAIRIEGLAAAELWRC